MKYQKPKNHSAKFSNKAHLAAKRRVKRNRPLHRTIILHPINFLLLLCAGVLLSVSTFSALAASYAVNGEVLAPIPTDPAVITSPTNNQQLSPQTQVISGTCLDNSYVEVSDNNSIAGIAICSQDGTFHVTATLSIGLNVLSAQDFNATNNPGPSSASVSVYYYPPSIPNNKSNSSAPLPAPMSTHGNQSSYVAPVAVKVLQVDIGIPFQANTSVPIVSYEPTVTGIAPPHSLIVVTIHTNPYYCHTYANSEGYWSCTFNQIIPPGQHTEIIMALTPSQQTITLPSFHIAVVAAAPKAQTTATKFSISTNYTYKVYSLNEPVILSLRIAGGVAPYAFTVTWGDGAISTYVEQTNKDFSITHTYNHLNAAFGSMPVKIAAVDANGDFSSLEIDTALRNSGYVAKIAGSTSSSFITSLRPWLTVLWPGYIVITLMVFSFWLGERQEQITLRSDKRLTKRPRYRHSH